MLTPVEQAINNNAQWCNTVCQAHNIPGEFRKALWLNPHPVPPFYPNAITLLPSAAVAEQQAYIQNLLAAGRLGRFAVKDSFCALDLAPLGFRVLFEATWLWRAPTQLKPSAALAGVQWELVRNKAVLAQWETAWAGAAQHPTRIFPPALLADRHTVFIAARQAEQVVAGAIAYRTGDVVGLSNVFGPPTELPRFWAGCVAAVMTAFPGLALVDYERGAELALAQSLGFKGIGPLRVWVREA